jgi:hypothetical protein
VVTSIALGVHPLILMCGVLCGIYVNVIGWTATWTWCPLWSRPSPTKVRSLHHYCALAQLVCATVSASTHGLCCYLHGCSFPCVLGVNCRFLFCCWACTDCCCCDGPSHMFHCERGLSWTDSTGWDLNHACLTCSAYVSSYRSDRRHRGDRERPREARRR